MYACTYVHTCVYAYLCVCVRAIESTLSHNFLLFTYSCPLWSDDRRMNAESVIKVCHETLKHIKQKNPQVDINVAALLPKLPPKVKGPHEDIAFANAVPVRR